MSARQVPCERVQPMLHAVIEGEASGAERRAVHAHVAACAACAAEMEHERELSTLLGAEDLARAPRELDDVARSARAPRSSRVLALRALPAAALLALLAALGALFPEPAAYGSISPARCLPVLQLPSGATIPLRAHNHLVVAPQEAQTIHMEGAGTLRIAGPAVMELDRSDEGWKLVLLRGQAQVELDAGARLEVTSVHGVRVLGAGQHFPRIDPAWFAGERGAEPQDDDRSPAELLAHGFTRFYQWEDFTGAEASFAAASRHPDATAEERAQADFYRIAAVARQGRDEDSVALGTAFLETYPDDEEWTPALLYFHGASLRDLGRRDEARTTWETLVERFPDAEITEHARNALAEPPRAAQPPPPADATGRSRALPAPAEAGGTLVATLDLRGDDAEARGFRAVANAVARFHGAASVDLSSDDLAALEKELADRRPRALVVVLPPDSLDVQLHRRLLLISARIDDDAFPDCVLGYLTASSAVALVELWERTLAVHESGLSARRWSELFVTSGQTSTEYPGHLPDLAVAAGFEGQSFGVAAVESDPKCLQFAARALSELEVAGVVTMTGNGDPEGIWLFDDHRNIDAAKHWPYAPERVGHDPDGSMPRILAADFARLELARPIVWSGTCHSAAVRRVWVEGDIVSTFGATDAATVHTLEPGESLGLAILEAGAAALLAPIAANHGYSVLLETDFALAHGASLGETIKSTWDDVFLQADGALVLHFPEPGDPIDYYAEHVMQGGGANRILIGDPLLAPFEPVENERERVRIENASADGFDVVVERVAGFHASAWDIYGTDRARDHRVRARIPIDALVPEDVRALSAEVELLDEHGAPVRDARLRHVEPESWHGRRYLHLQVNAPRQALDGRAVTARFRVRFERAPR